MKRINRDRRRAKDWAQDWMGSLFIAPRAAAKFELLWCSVSGSWGLAAQGTSEASLWAWAAAQAVAGGCPYGEPLTGWSDSDLRRLRALDEAHEAQAGVCCACGRQTVPFWVPYFAGGLRPAAWEAPEGLKVMCGPCRSRCYRLGDGALPWLAQGALIGGAR